MLKLIIWCALAYVCHELAEHKHRDTLFWTIIGFLFGVWGVLILLILPKKHR